MEAAKNIFWLTTILWLSATAQEVHEPPAETTTENVEDFTYDATEKVTQSPDDNGMAIGDIPEELKPDSQGVVESKEVEPSAVEEQPVVISFPDNHKNFTPSQYLGPQEFPPYYNHLNSYQQQYKNYYEQKQIYNSKPIKFEENSLKNFYLPTGGADALNLKDDKKMEGFRLTRNPFPYTFDNDRGRDHSNWYKDKGHPLVHEQPSDGHLYRGHQENVFPYQIYPHSYPYEEKFYKNELLNYDNHHVKKEEKGSPWKKVFHVLTALVPLGLLLATLTPNVIAINSTGTTKTTRQSSEEPSPFQFKEEDVIKLMKKYGVESLTEMQCEDRVICELAREGGKITAEPIEKGFWFLANQTPWDVAEKAGMNELFKAIKTGNCEVYKCHSKGKSGRKSSFAKKLIRKHKTAG